MLEVRLERPLQVPWRWDGFGVWVGHSVRLRSGQALSDAFDFVAGVARRGWKPERQNL